jgi:hypothetical protein
MSTQPEALRLADALGNLEATGHCSDSVSLTDRSEAIADAAAAELRRLHADVERLTRERDALLEALKRAEPLLIGPILLQARAAIKAVEEGK